MNSTYQTGIQTGLINELLIDQIQSLNRAYKTQNSIDDFTKIMLTGLINMNLQHDEKSIQKLLNFLAITVEGVINIENQLINDYVQVLRMIPKNK